MQFKNKLLSGVIASAVIFGTIGTAHAVDIDVTVNTIVRGDTTVAPNTALPFASEVASSDGSGSTSTNALDNGTATVRFDVTTGSFPSGNIIMQLQLNGGTFRGALSGATAFDFTGCNDTVTDPTANISIGGADGGNTVTFLISNLNDCGNTDNPTVSLPFDVNSPTSDVSLVMTILTESGTVPVDNTNGRTIPLVRLTKAFEVLVLPDAGTAIADVQAVGGPYLRFVGGLNETLGSFDLNINAVYVNLGGAAAATLADPAGANVTNATATVAGDFAPFVVANGGAANIGGAAALNAGRTLATEVFTAAGAPPDSTLATLIGIAAVTVTADTTTPIQNSAYNGSLLLNLVAGFTDFTTTAPLTPIVRNGTTAKLPWTASNTQAGGTGSQNFVRVSNPTALTFGPIFAKVLASTIPATVNVTTTLAPSLAPGAEVLFSATQLEALLGNFGRADIEISVEGTGAIIARLVQRTDGTYEINNR